jgi:tape measure domain-containing protein
MSIFALGIDFTTRGDKQMKTAFDQNAAAADRAERSINKVRKATDQLSASYMIATKALAAFGIAAGAAGVVRLTSAYTTMNNQLVLVTGTQAEANRLLGELNEIAGRTRSPLDAMVTLYSRVAMSAKELGASQKDLKQFTENVGMALAMQGGSIEQARGALLQMSQALGGGTVRAEEFNSMLDGALPIVQAAARGIDGAGGSVARLRKMVIEGKVSSEEFFDAILSQSKELEAQFAKMAPTIGQAMQRLYDNGVMVVGSFDQMVGASAAVATAILAIGNNLQFLLSVGVAAAAFFAARYVVVMGVAVVQATMQAVTATIALEMALGATSTASALASAGIKLFSSALTVLRGAIIATGIGALVVGAGYLISKFIDLVRATGGFGEAMTLLGETASAVWDGMVMAAKAIPPGLAAVWGSVKADFFMLVSDLINTWAGFVAAFANSLSSIGLDSAAAAVNEKVTELNKSSGDWAASSMEAAAAADAMSVKAKGLAEGGLAKAQEALGKLRAKADEATAGLAGGTGGNPPGGVAGAAGKAAKATDELAKAADKWRDRLKDSQTPLEKYRSEFAELEELYRKGYLSLEEFNKGQKLLTDELADGVPLVGELSDAIGDFVASGFKDIASLGDMFKNVLKQMVADAARNQIMLWFQPQVAGAAGTAGGAGGTSAGGGGILSSLGGVFAEDGWLMTGLNSGTGVLGTIGGWLGMGGGTAGAGAAGGLAGSLGALGGMLGTVGAIIGGIGMVISIGKKLFGRELKDTGISGTFSGSGFEGSSYKYYKGGLFRSDKTSYEALDPEVQSTIGAAYGDLRQSVVQMAGVLDLGTKAIRGFSYSFKISTKDMSEEEALQALQDEMAKAGSGMAELVLGTDKFGKAGETALDTLTRLSTSLAGFNDAMVLLSNDLRLAGLRGADIASNLMDQFGGLEGFSSAVSNYWDKFYSEQERNTTLIRQATRALREYGVELPRSRDEYRALVDSIDLSDKSTHKLYATLLGLADVMDQVLPSVDGLTRKLERLQTRLAGILADIAERLRESITANRAAANNWRKIGTDITDYLDKMRATASALVDPRQARAASRADYLRTLSRANRGNLDAAGEVTGKATAYLANVNATAGSRFEAAFAQARVMAQLGDLGDIAETEADKLDRVASLQERQLKLIERVQELLAAGKTLSEEQLATLREKLGALDKQIQDVSLVGGLGDISLLPEKKMDKLTDAIRELRLAVVAETRRQEKEKATRALNAYVGNLTANKAGNHFVDDGDLARMARIVGLDTEGMSTNEIRKRLANFSGRDLLKGTVYDPTGEKEQAYLDRLNRPPPPKAVEPQWAEGLLGFWQQLYNNPSITVKDIMAASKGGRPLSEVPGAIIEKTPKKKATDVKKFANGGQHEGGLRVVGEYGQELEHAGRSRIYSNSQSRQLLRTDEIVAELKAVRSELRETKEEQRQLGIAVAQNTKKTKDVLERWNVVGMPATQV